MEVSSSTGSASVQVDVMKKAQDVQEKQIQQLLESSQEQSKEVTAQKTGVGGNLNITG
ncbi:putative motility protein [Sulfurimonas sp.]|uniref:putative motility protein n=1 Tax=Sulfurimonas sp. TaxID=2022749 RepID=UPI00260C67B2|nr:putative motility protein [Sulfurimonas sp.]